MGDWNVMDVQLRIELATHTIVNKTANGHRTLHGVSALSHATEDLKTEPGCYNNKHEMGEWIALERQPNSGIVICMDARSIAFGLPGARGICVPNHVEEACKEELVPF